MGVLLSSLSLTKVFILCTCMNGAAMVLAVALYVYQVKERAQAAYEEALRMVNSAEAGSLVEACKRIGDLHPRNVSSYI